MIERLGVVNPMPATRAVPATRDVAGPCPGSGAATFALPGQAARNALVRGAVNVPVRDDEPSTTDPAMELQ